MTTLAVPEARALDLLGDLPRGVEVLVWDGHTPAPPGAEAIEFFVGLYNAPAPPAERLAQLPALKVIQLLSAGVEPWLPVVPPGVRLCNGRGIHGATTAELAVAGLLAVLRDLPTYLDAQRARRWDPVRSGSLDGGRVLVIGVGDIGAKVAGVARILGAEVTVVGRTARDGVHAAADLPDLVPAQDAVVIAVPHTPDTDGLVDAGLLAALPDGAVVVNVARGAVVDTDALLAELTAGRLRAFLDVTDPEPLPADHPLWSAPNLLITPHVGGGTRGWKRRAYRLVAEQVHRFAAGEPLVNEVTGAF